MEVVLDSVDDDFRANVDDFAVCKIRFILVQRLIYLLVHADSITEIFRCIFGIHAFVVRARRLHFEDIAHYEIFVVAFTLNVKRFDVFRVAALLDPSPPSFCTIGRIEDRNQIVGSFEPIAHISNCCLCCCLSQFLAFFVRSVEKGRVRLWCRRAAVIANIETLGGNTQPSKIADH